MSSKATLSDLAPIYGIFGYLVCYPTICLMWLANNKDNLQNKDVIEKYGKLYNGIATYRKDNAIYYYPVFILRRLLFVAIPITFSDMTILEY